MDSALLAKIQAAHENVRDTARAEPLEALRRAGRLTAREALTTLLDPGSAIEYGPLAGATSRPEDDQAADGLVAVAGEVDGQPVVAAAFDESVRGGTISDRNARKLARLLYLAVTHRWPVVIFANGAGSRLDDPSPPPPILTYTRGRWDIYDGLAELSGWVPTIVIVSGAARGAHVGLATLADLVIATESASFADGTGFTASESARTGDVDVLVADESAAIATARQYLDLYNPAAEGDAGPAAPQADTIADVIPDNRRRPYDMRHIVTAFADDGSTLELNSAFGRSMLTYVARLEGRAIGIFANQPKSPLAGAIDAAAADKASRFVERCNAYGLPIVSFVDNPGYMVGPQAESEGIARHHARPLAALHHRDVPLVTVQLRKAYGLGPYAMSGFGAGRHVPALKLAWPSVESGGMSLEGAAYLVKRKEILAAPTREEGIKIRDAYAESMRDAASGVRAGRTFSFDDVIDPRDTRSRIATLIGRLPRQLPSVKPHPIDPR